MSLVKDKRTRANSIELQHRHFAFIASVIAGLPDHTAFLRTRKMATALAFANACAETNPSFDRNRFLKACYNND